MSIITFSQTAWEWVDGVTTSKNECANSLVVDSINQFVYVAGFIDGAPPTYTGILSANMNGGTDNGKKDGFVAKYDFNGNVIWSFNIGGTADDEITGITIDPNGKIYVTGYVEGMVSFEGATAGNPGNSAVAFGNKDVFIASYLPTGALEGFKIFGGTGNDWGVDICASSFQVYITGFYDTDADFDGITPSTIFNKKNLFVYSMDILGNTLWLFDMGSDGDDYDAGKAYKEKNMGIACDEDNVYVIGMLNGTGLEINNSDGSWESPLMNEDNKQDIFILSIDNFGFYNWGHLINNVSNDVRGMDIAEDCEGVYIAGNIEGNAKFPSGYVMATADDNGFFCTTG